MKIMHIMSESTFAKPYIKFINENFDSKAHTFLLLSNNDEYFNNTDSNTHQIKKDKRSVLLMLKQIYSSDKVILHSIFFPHIVLLLYLQPWLLKKCYWVVWGGDLYSYRNQKAKFKSKIYEMMRRVIIRNMGGLITHIKGDYELAREWYGAKGKYYYSFMYPSNLYKEYDLSNVNKDNDKTYIQVGNSADPSNNHIEVFEKLLPYRDENIEIICPLSYGNKEYATEVIRKGKEMFGEKFNPLVDFMPFEEYLEVLAKIDIAIFNHKRQQAVGNITTLLGLGKKVYIRKDINTWKFCKDLKLNVNNIIDNDENILIPINFKCAINNSKIIQKEFSLSKLILDSKYIFDSNTTRVK